MPFNKKILIIIVNIFCIFTIVGCAQVKNYSPNALSKSYTLTNFPRNKTEVNVNDFRANSSDDGYNLCNMIKQQIESSLSTNQTKYSYIISVDIIEHKSFFTLGNWNAEILFRVNITTSSGNEIALFDVTGRASLSNMWGYSTAKAVSQEAYNLAISDLMSKLSHVKTI